MKMFHKYIGIFKCSLLGGLGTLFLLLPLTLQAQESRTAYHLEGNTSCHELNPAMQPDSSYMSLPLLGGTSLGFSSSMKMGDLLFDREDGTLTTFMNSNTISKSDLMDRVGNGLQNSLDLRLTLLSFGRRANSKRYQTFSLGWRTQVNTFLDKGLFDLAKEVENKVYNIGETSVKASSYFELAYGESHRITDKLTIGAKAKLLLGLVNADAELTNLTADLTTDEWTAQGKATLNMSGIKPLYESKEYNSKAGTYNMVNDFDFEGVGIRGIGLAIDAGATYKYNDQLTFSAAILDLGFISWSKSHKAENSGEKFTFKGFRDISTEKEDETSLQNQWDRISDDLIDMANLEDKGTGSNTTMLACTLEAGATYKYSTLTFGALLTSRIYGKSSWTEGRLNVSANLLKRFDVVLSPAYSTFGTSLGAMLNYKSGGFNAFIASDRLFTQVNKQFIPTSLNAAIQFGVSFGL